MFFLPQGALVSSFPKFSGTSVHLFIFSEFMEGFGFMFWHVSKCRGYTLSEMGRHRLILLKGLTLRVFTPGWSSQLSKKKRKTVTRGYKGAMFFEKP